MIKAALAKILTVKIAALCIAAGGAGGVALAASTGHLPDPLQRHVPGHTAQPGESAHRSGTPSALPSRTTPPYTLLELCHRYQERNRVQRRTALRNEAEFSELVARLGSPDQDKADKFCADLRRAWPSSTINQPTTAPSTSPATGTRQPGNGTGPASTSGTGTGQPSNRPAGTPTAQPTTQPSNRTTNARR